VPRHHVACRARKMDGVDWVQEYHLTLTGWIEGTCTIGGSVHGVPVPRPPNALETWEGRRRLRKTFPKESTTYSLLWREPSVSDEKRAAVRRLFRAPFTATDC
jgi:hypothetical protein